jgi:hypothetical protein
MNYRLAYAIGFHLGSTSVSTGCAATGPRCEHGARLEVTHRFAIPLRTSSRRVTPARVDGRSGAGCRASASVCEIDAATLYETSASRYAATAVGSPVSSRKPM